MSLHAASMAVAACLTLGLSVGRAQAACLVEPLAPQLQAADVVYVGTVVASKIDTAENPLPKRPKRFEYLPVHHVVVPQVVYKGDPTALGEVMSSTLTWDPAWLTGVRSAEHVDIAPSDVVLIVGDNGEPAQVEFCSASRPWDAETKRAVHAAFARTAPAGAENGRMAGPGTTPR